MVDLLDDDGLLAIGARKTTDEELAQYAKPAPRPAPVENGTCHLCENPGIRTCQGCERPTCAAHHWVMFGLCRACASEDRVQGWNKERSVGPDWLEKS